MVWWYTEVITDADVWHHRLCELIQTGSIPENIPVSAV